MANNESPFGFVIYHNRFFHSIKACLYWRVDIDEVTKGAGCRNLLVALLIAQRWEKRLIKRGRVGNEISMEIFRGSP